MLAFVCAQHTSYMQYVIFFDDVTTRLQDDWYV